MPRFFFDVAHGNHFTQDTEGTERPSLRDAHEEAIGFLMEMARGQFHKGERNSVATQVRDERGNVVFTAKLVLQTDWTGQD